MDAATIVIIVGIVVMVVVIIGFLVIYGLNNDTLIQAGQNLEDAITLILSGFTSLGLNIASSFARLLTQIRDIFASLVATLSDILAGSITFFTTAFARVFRTITHLTVQIARQYTELYNKGVQILTTLAFQISAKMVTIPTDVGLRLILAFVNLVTDGIQFITCFATTAFDKIGNLFEDLGNELEDFFVNGLANLGATILNALAPGISLLVNLAEQSRNILLNLPTIITKAVAPLLVPLQKAIRGIICNALLPVCEGIPVVSCNPIRCVGCCPCDAC